MKLKIFLFTLLGILSISSWQKFALAQVNSEQICQYIDEPKATTTRVVRLDNLGVEVTIPFNYRAMQRENGEVMILDPGTFALLECLANQRRRGGGIYYQSLQLIPRSSSLSFREQVLSSVGITPSSDNNESENIEVISDTWNNRPSYLISHASGYAVNLMILMPGEEILALEVACDCPVEIDEVLDLANRVRLIEN